MQKVFDNGRVMDVGICGHDAVNQSVLTVDTDMSLHTKVPLIAFSGLVDIGVADIILVVGRVRCLGDAGIHDGAA